MSRLLPLLLIFYCGVAAAQDRSNISLSIGPAQPTGAFASQNGNNLGSGLARIGGLLAATYQRSLGSGLFGLSASLRARLNPMNEDANLAYARSIDTGYAYTVAKKSWMTGALYAGGWYRTPLSHRLILELGISVGVADAVRPALSATALRPSVDYPGSQDYRM